MLAVTYLAERNAHAWSPEFVVPLAIAIVALWMFFRHIDHVAYPFIAPRLISGSGFGAVNLVNATLRGRHLGRGGAHPALRKEPLRHRRTRLRYIADRPRGCRNHVVDRWCIRFAAHGLPATAVCRAGRYRNRDAAACRSARSPASHPMRGSPVRAFLVGTGRGANNPASRNAGLQLAPEHSSTLAALRTMCMEIGTIVTISIDTAILASSHDPGRIQAWLFAGAAALFVAALPLIARVPEHRGSW